MELDQLPVSDGHVQKIIPTPYHLKVIFIDWQEKQWVIEFEELLAFESFCIENKELDSIQIVSGEHYIDRVRKVFEEPDLDATCYAFFPAWTEEPLLRVLAERCQVYLYQGE
jgi:hypothetical protein